MNTADIPEFMLISQAARAAAWKKYKAPTSVAQEQQQRWRDREAGRKEERRARDKERYELRKVGTKNAKHSTKHPDRVEQQLRKRGLLT